LAVTTPPSVEPSGGVIKDARRRQRQRRRRIGAVAGVLAAASVLAWAAVEAPSDSATKVKPARGAGIPPISQVDAIAFNARLYPFLHVGEPGWCYAIEENGRTGSSACGALPTPSAPVVMALGFGNGNGPTTTVAITTPEVASLLANGVQRVPTVLVRGLPYGLRAARVVTSEHEAVPPGIEREIRHGGTVLVAYNAAGQQLPADRYPRERPLQVRSWHAPTTAPATPCKLEAGGLPGLVASSGKAVDEIRGLPDPIVGEAFLPCAETRYTLRGEPVRGLILLNAADPSRTAGALPNFDQVPGSPSVFTEGGALTAERDGKAWLLVGQGTGPAQRMELLRHLRAVVKP